MGGSLNGGRLLGLSGRAALPALLAAAMAAGVSAQTTAPKPAPPGQVAPLQDGWEEIDQRLVFLSIELSSVESSMAAVDKAIHIAGYEQSGQHAKAVGADKGNEVMDRNGGGPVSWQSFYCRTAQDFYFHPGATVQVHARVGSGREASIDAQATGTPTPIDRPPQFDYIYRANEKNKQQAEEEAAKLGGKINELRTRRRELEAEQSALWCKIAFRALSSRDLAAHPLYRFDLTIAGTDDLSKQQLAAIKAGADFMRAINQAVDQAQSAVDGDEKAALDGLEQSAASARSALDRSLMQQAGLAAVMVDPRSSLDQFSKSAKRLVDSSQNMVDAYRIAAESDAKEDWDRKNNFRGQLQQMVMDFAATVMTAEQRLSAAATEWKVSPDTTKAIAASSPVVVSKVVATNQQSADAIEARLDQAKAAYRRATSSSKASLIAVIDSRITAATDAGDLKTIKSLQQLKESAEADGTISSDVTDASIVAAKARYNQEIQADNAQIADAYRQTIRDFTKARQIEQADKIQTEFDGLPELAQSGAGDAGKSRGALLVEANIDGDSELHLTKSGIYWKELGLVKPGMANRNHLPTYVNGKAWLPVWGNPRPGARRRSNPTSAP